MAISTAEGFEGYPATWFYLDRQAGTLTESVPAGGTFVTADTVSVSITPRYFNAPRRAEGATDQTQFLKQAKPSAYVKVQLDQVKPGTSTKPLTYAALYPIVDNPNDDISSVFFSDPASGDPLQAVPLPGGSGGFRTPITAVVGGAKPKSSLLTIITQVLGLAGGTAAGALFPIPAADLTLASNIESLLNSAATTFAPEARQQYWIKDTAISLCANESSAAGADDDCLLLKSGTTTFVVFQTGDGGQIEAAVKAIAAQPGLTFDIDRGGALVASQNGSVVSPNPFANFIYITYRASVQNPDA